MRIFRFRMTCALAYFPDANVESIGEVGLVGLVGCEGGHRLVPPVVGWSCFVPFTFWNWSNERRD